MERSIKSFVVLNIDEDKWVVAKGYRLYWYYPQTDCLCRFSKIHDGLNSFISHFRLFRRLFRAEVRCLYHFHHDTWVAIARKGIFRFDEKTHLFERCMHIEKGSRPMNLCQGADGAIYYGEYCFNPDRMPMRIFKSKDNGKTWSVAYTFARGEINHIHGIFADPFTGRLWVATGDDDSACIFGYSDDGFNSLVKYYYGSQKYRVCVPLFNKEKIIFATDSQYTQNVIRSIDRKTGLVTDVQQIQGSGIYAVQNGGLMLISTSVEPSVVNKDNFSHLWYSWDGHDWKELISFEKDRMPKTFFQFGSIRFPSYQVESRYVAFNGRALKKIDGKTIIIPVSEFK